MATTTTISLLSDRDYRVDAELLGTAYQLVDIYLLFARDNDIGNDLVDEVELPTVKAALVDAFRLAIAAEVRPNIRTLLIKAGMTLAQYHRGLGCRIPIRALTPQGRPQGVPPQCAPRQFQRRLNKALLASAEERVRLVDIFHRALVESMH